MNLPSVITIELRNPRTKDEIDTYGEATILHNQARIFINARKNRSKEELRDTLIHECYHAVVGLFKLSTKNEELRARRLGEYARFERGSK